MNIRRVVGAIGVASMGLAVSASAVNLSLSPGTFSGMPADDPAMLGTLAASMVSPDVQDLPDLRFTSRVYSAVYADDPNNPWASGFLGTGGLTFWYRMENIDDGVTEGRPLQGLAIPLGFPTLAVEVNQDDSAAGAVAADIAGLNFAAASSVGFIWIGDTVDLTETSAWVALYTDYTGFSEGLVGIADGTVEDVPALVPSGASMKVPEPVSTAGLFALALAVMGAWASRLGKIEPRNSSGTLC
jgi:hypothetical protein